MEKEAEAFVRLLRKGGNKAFRRYELKAVDGHLMLVRNELCRMFDLALNDATGCEIEPDEKDGMFLD
jgi:hypothetical protein